MATVLPFRGQANNLGHPRSRSAGQTHRQASGQAEPPHCEGSSLMPAGPGRRLDNALILRLSLRGARGDPTGAGSRPFDPCHW